MRAVALLCLLASCAPGTFVVLTFEGANGAAPAGVKSIDLELMLNGKPAKTTFSAKGGAELTLPETASLEIHSGSGELAIVAVARDARGDEMGRGSGSGTISRGATAKI